MRAAVRLLTLFLAAALGAQDTVYVCPMDPDIRSQKPGVCSRCGMKLRAGIPDPVEFHMNLKLTPARLKVRQPAQLAFTIRDPWKNRPVTHFQMVHERLFHMFVVSQDLDFFVHDHPRFGEDGTFRYDLAFPKPGMYRVLGDFYPDGATPQLIAKSVIVSGAPPAPVSLTRDYSTKRAENIEVELVTDPPQPIAHMKTLLYFRITPADGLEKYLGAWGHLLSVSDDLIDLDHTHPFLTNGPEIEFVMVFPRARTFRVWAQFQRSGVVNTVHFDVPVKNLE